MTCKERIYQALNFQESDVIPYNISIEASVAERLDEHYGGRDKCPNMRTTSPEQVREEIRTCARVLSKNGGYIMETTKPIRPEVPTENSVAALETIIEEAHGCIGS